MQIYFKFLEVLGWKMFIVQTCWPNLKSVHKDNIYELSTWLKYSLIPTSWNILSSKLLEYDVL